MKETIEHPCGECGKEIPNWRRNKKFCNEACKYSFHNKQRELIDEDMKHVNKILANNYVILKQIMEEDKKVETLKSYMEQLGFAFDFCTQYKSGYYNVYTISWRMLDSEKVLLSQVPRRTYRGGYIIK